MLGRTNYRFTNTPITPNQNSYGVLDALSLVGSIMDYKHKANAEKKAAEDRQKMWDAFDMANMYRENPELLKYNDDFTAEDVDNVLANEQLGYLPVADGSSFDTSEYDYEKAYQNYLNSLKDMRRGF
jgi:hypothetical protein